MILCYYTVHTTNSKYHMAYLFVPFPVTLDDLEGHSPNAELIRCNLMNSCATFSTVLTDMIRELLVFHNCYSMYVFQFKL